MRSLRISIVLPVAGLSGGTRIVASHARGLLDHGHRVNVVSLPNPRPTLRQRLGALKRGEGWLRYDQPPSLLDEYGVPYRVLESWRPVTGDDLPDADVVIATWWRTAEWVAGLPPSKGVKVFFVQGYVPDTPVSEAVRATWRLPLHKIVVSRWLADIGRVESGDPDIAIVPNGTDVERFDAPPRQKQPVLTVGMIYSESPTKGADVGFAAVEQARQSVPNLRLIAFSSERPHRNVPVPAYTEFHHRPSQPRLRELYAACDVWLLPSRSEGFGLPLLEAMACRTPVISTPTGVASELLAGGGGFVVPGDDPAGMADAILRVSALRDAEWRALSDRAYEAAHGYTSMDAAALFERTLRDIHAQALAAAKTPELSRVPA